MKLTSRDKMLLIIVFLVIVWALGIVFLIKPKIDEVSKKNSELDNVEGQLVTVQREVEAAKTIKEDCNDALKAAQEGAKNFFDIPTAYEAESYLAKVLSGGANGEGKVEITSLSITGPSAVALSVYRPTVDDDIKVPLNDAANISGATQDNTIVLSDGETLGCYNYTVSFKAYREDLMKFLTNIKTTEHGNSLFVTSLNIADNTIAETEMIEGSMSFSLYFVKKLEGANVDEIIEQQLAAVETTVTE